MNLINKLKELNCEFDKFFASKILGRKYIRTGSCKACGRCCQEIYVRHSKHIISDEKEFESLKNIHFFYSYLKVIGKNENGLVFECTKLDKEKGVCTAYRHRAVICRQYPQEEIFMMGGVISDTCGYNFTPIKSFDEVFSKVKKDFKENIYADSQEESIFMSDYSCDVDEYEQFKHKYKIIAFDWDGTAVINRHEDASIVTAKIEELLKLNVYIVVITGTNFENINKQFSSKIFGQYKRNLLVCTNRGSEVWGFDENSQPVLLYRITATDDENALMDKIIEKVKKEIESISNIKVNIIYNRFNRRKLDLIPEWEDPPKQEIDKLLDETQKRLEQGGFSGGIIKAFNALENMAKSAGFTRAKITSDVKHLEIGITDKSDSIKWILLNIAKKHDIPNDEILIGGDEFGEIGGFEGSDHKMFMKDEPGIKYFSVGIEPNGVPEPIINLGGGPDCFIRVLEIQASLHHDSLKQPDVNRGS